MSAVNWRWVAKSFLATLPRLLMAMVALIWTYCSVDYFVRWGYRIFTGVMLIEQKPLGGDFSYYWVASQLALAGNPVAVYDPARLQAALAAIFGLPLALHFFYPPNFLLAVLPFALLPYHASLAVWLLSTMAAYLWVIKRVAPHWLAVAAGIMFAGAVANVGYGQNGFLSTALLGGGLLLLDKSPLAGGFLLGLLTYKPHLAVLVPVALIAGRHWRALMAMAASAAGLILASGLILGYGVWRVFLTEIIPGFVKSLGAGQVMTAGAFPWAKMPTLFSAIYASGLGFGPAIMMQGMVSLTVALLVWRVWSQEVSPAVRGSLLVLGTLLFTPYLVVYDLCLLALPLAWLAWDGHLHGWSPGEQYLLFSCWMMPMFSEEIARASRLPLAPLFLILLVYLALRRLPRWRAGAVVGVSRESDNLLGS
jgi:alpha-1,2-mannosyltransferase